MEGYFLFRGDILVAGKPNDFSAGGLHEQGMEGDLLVSLHPRSITTYPWQDIKVSAGVAWGNSHRETTDKYRVLILLQQ